jgi:hypothetical protein
MPTDVQLVTVNCDISRGVRSRSSVLEKPPQEPKNRPRKSGRIPLEPRLGPREGVLETS